MWKEGHSKSYIKVGYYISVALNFLYVRISGFFALASFTSLLLRTLSILSLLANLQ